MQILTKGITGTTVEGADGYVGMVQDVFFSSDTWRVRYLVVDTGKWLPGRQIVLAPQAIERTDWPSKSVFVRQTREQIKGSPPVLEHEPVSRQKEVELARYYHWPSYWGETTPFGPTPMMGGLPATPMPGPAPPASGEKTPPGPETSDQAKESDLRSAEEVIGYRVKGVDDQVGHVQDFIVDDEAWVIRYLVVDTKRWRPSGSVLVSPAWAEEISWDEKTVRVGLTREQVQGSPEFSSQEPVNRRLEEQLYDYYGRPAYWR